MTLPHLPQSWRGRRAVFISDLHLGQIRGRKFAEKVVKIVTELAPDIILNGGDMYDGVAVNVTDIIQPFTHLHAPLGLYFVMGNHEEFRDNKLYAAAITSAGIKILNNEKVIVDRLQLLGVDYKTTTMKEDFADIVQKMSVDTNQASILLKHVPVDLEVAKHAGISLQLSGHTHRAQIFPLGLITRMIYKGYDYGLKNFGSKEVRAGSLQVLTTSGVGTWGPPLRVGTQSEIVLITFK